MGVASCSSKKKRGGAARQEGLTGGMLVFSDEFDRSELGQNWIQRSGKWSIKDGQLHVQGDRNEGLWLNIPLPERARVEFDARSESAEGDLKFEIFNTEPRHETGYVVIMGGWNNSMSIIARLDEHGDDRREAGLQVEKGRTYRFAAVRTDNTLRWYVDGRLVLEWPDEAPIRGVYFGFNNWTSPVYYDNLAIFGL
jgi:hypothetical protein